MIRRIAFLFFLILAALPLFGQNRSFDDLFPLLDREIKNEALSSEGFIETYDASLGLLLLPASRLGLAMAQPVLDRAPSFLVEALRVIPYTGSPVKLVEVYNALGRVRDLSGRLYHSATRDRDIPLFEDAARIESLQKTTILPDPPDGNVVPSAETIYLRLKDANFGTSYYRADITRSQPGILYRLSNARNLTYTFIPVIREGKFIAQLYIEPLTEGLLIYSIAGAEVSDFVASFVDIPSAVRKRLDVITGWLIDGIF